MQENKRYKANKQEVVAIREMLLALRDQGKTFSQGYQALLCSDTFGHRITRRKAMYHWQRMDEQAYSRQLLLRNPACCGSNSQVHNLMYVWVGFAALLAIFIVYLLKQA